MLDSRRPLVVPPPRKRSARGKNAGHFSHVLPISVAELCNGFPFLAPPELNVHDDEDRKHHEREKRRTLHKKTEHHQDGLPGKPAPDTRSN
jgi:hypothetical protein